jgi:hypothetical protein
MIVVLPAPRKPETSSNVEMIDNLLNQNRVNRTREHQNGDRRCRHRVAELERTKAGAAAAAVPSFEWRRAELREFDLGPSSTPRASLQVASDCRVQNKYKFNTVPIQMAIMSSKASWIIAALITFPVWIWFSPLIALVGPFLLVLHVLAPKLQRCQ